MIPESFLWQEKEYDMAAVQALCQDCGCPEYMAKLLVNRHITEKTAYQRFFNAVPENMYDPYLMKDMAQAVDAIVPVVRQGEKITIYGDYDVDGITSTSILYLYLKRAGAQTAYYLPDRMTEGYGLNADAIEKIAKEGTKLLLTVDTGITAVKETALAVSLGMTVVITDHHECQEEIPQAAAVIDAKRPDNTYPFPFLCGAGVAFKLVQALEQVLKTGQDIEKYLEIAAVGTVADIVPLYDENRVIVSMGFKQMRNPSNQGLKKLLEVSGYDFLRKLTSGFIGFGVAPRLNAGGRMGDAQRGVRLFITEDEEERSAIVEELNQENQKRQETEKLILEAVTEKIEADEGLKQSAVMVVTGEHWHHGVVGIVSSRIKDTYYRPNIILSIEDGVATGSARSVDGFNLFEALMVCKDLMTKFGGHAAAAGMTLPAENVPELYRRLNEYAASHVDSNILTPKQMPELVFAPEEITEEMIHRIEEMEPFGPELPQPVVAVSGAIGDIACIGKDKKTLRVKLGDRNQALTAIGFGKYGLKDYFYSGQRVKIAGFLNINTYMNRNYPQIMMKDMQPAGDFEASMAAAYRLRNLTADYQGICSRFGRLSVDICNEVYRYLNRHAAQSVGTDEEGWLLLSEACIWPGENMALQNYRLLQALTVFEELGLLQAEVSCCCVHYMLIRGKKAKLSDSRWFNTWFYRT